MEYIKLDEATRHGHLFQLIIDSLDSSNFLFCIQHDREIRLFGCCLKDGKLLCDLKWLTYDFDPYAEMPSLKLEGNFLYGLRMEEKNNKTSVIFNKFTIDQKKIECTKFCDIVTDFEFDLRGLRGIRFSWSGNTCYGMKYLPEGDTQIFAFDLDKQTLAQFKYRDIGTFRDLIVKNGVIFVCTVNDDTKSHAWHRIAVNEPVSLFNLSLDAIHLHTLFLSDKELNSWLERLPKSLHPFEGIDSKIQPKSKWFPSRILNLFRR